MDHPNRIDVTSLDHDLLKPYLEMRFRNWTRLSGIFIAEGPLLVERLIRSQQEIESVLLDRKYLQHYLTLVPRHVPVLVVEHDQVEEIVGFNFHRGVLACGRRPPLHNLQDVAPLQSSSETWVGLMGVQDPENVGGILRSAAGIGVKRVLIGPGTADPFSRRALRVSMGNVLALELYESRQPARDLGKLRQLGVECVATALTEDALPLESSYRSGPLMILVGNEKHGLPADLLAQADRRVRIDMLQNTDSLNVSVAAAITMYHFVRLGQAHPRGGID